jgi:carbonic anhydrase
VRLFEAIIDANHRAVAGDANAGLHPAEFADALPVVALTCIDPRLNSFFPNALALPAEQFIWLRNAGNLITGAMSSTMRSLALACAVKGGREIAIIGHTDCQIAKTPMTKLLDELQALGVERSRLPDNLNDFFGAFSSERQNVIKACDFARQSPLIGSKIPVHGLLIDVETGKLDWVVNGYETLAAPAPPPKTDFAALRALGAFQDFDLGEMKFPEMKIGEAAAATSPETASIKPVGAPPAAMPVSVEEIAEKHWPKPPLTTLPPKKKSPPPPPLRPRPTFQR